MNSYITFIVLSFTIKFAYGDIVNTDEPPEMNTCENVDFFVESTLVKNLKECKILIGPENQDWGLILVPNAVFSPLLAKANSSRDCSFCCFAYGENWKLNVCYDFVNITGSLKTVFRYLGTSYSYQGPFSLSLPNYCYHVDACVSVEKQCYMDIASWISYFNDQDLITKLDNAPNSATEHAFNEFNKRIMKLQEYWVQMMEPYFCKADCQLKTSVVNTTRV